jgi:hypothetical protein
MDYVTTKQAVASLLENFASYVNTETGRDPWFEVGEINQHFAWEDVLEETLRQWLDELVAEGKVEVGPEGWQWSL